MRADRRLLKGPLNQSFGFTLIEILVTLLLIGIITGFAMLRLRGDAQVVGLADQARRLAAVVGLQRDEALLLSQQRGIRFSKSGYSVFGLTGNGDWLAQPDQRDHELPAGVRLRLEIEGQAAPIADAGLPQVVLLSTGEATDFAATLTARDGAAYRVAGDGLGRLRVYQP